MLVLSCHLRVQMLWHFRAAPKAVRAKHHALQNHAIWRQAIAVPAFVFTGPVLVKGVCAVEILFATLALVAVAG